MADRRPLSMRRTAAIRRAEAKVARAAARALNVLREVIRDELRQSGQDDSVLSSRHPRWVTAVEAEVLPEVSEVFVAGLREAAREGSIDATPYAARHLESVWNRLVGVADTVFDELREELRDGWLNGETIPEIAKRVDGYLGDAQRWKNRSITVARTEVIGANNAGARDGARHTADVLGVAPEAVVKEWLPTFDARTRATHKVAAGQQVLGIDAVFTVGAGELQHPGDPNGPAQEVINCRCTALYHYPGDPDYPGVVSSGGRMTTTGSDAATGIRTMVHKLERRRAADHQQQTLRASGVTCADHPCVCGGCDEFDCGMDACACCWVYNDADELVPEPHAAEAVAALAAGTEDDPDPDDDQEANTSTVVVALPAGSDPITELAAVDGGAHSTLLWFGEVTDEEADAIRAAVEGYLANDGAAEPFDVGRGDVDRLGDDLPQALVVKLTDTMWLEQVREALLADDAVRTPWEAQKQWPTFTPHVTIGYPETEEEATALEDAAAALPPEVHFDRLAVWQADRVDEYPLASSDTEEEPTEEDEGMTAAAPEAVVETDAETAADLTWEGPLVAEGIKTGDGRKIEVGAIKWMGTPGVLFAMWDGGSGFGGHEDQVPIGLITSVERRDDGRLWATGTWADDEDGQKARRMNIDGRLRGVSVDLDDVEVHLEREDGTPIEGDDIFDIDMDEEVTLVIESARLRGATLWAIPAFVEAYVLDSTVADQAPDTSLVAAAADVRTGISITAAAVYSPPARSAQAAPVEAFAYPGAENLHHPDGTPRGFTMTDDGRVFGYAATWGTCHIGIDGACVTPPTSETDYAHFLTRDYETADGTHLSVGAITLGTGHAPLELRARPAAEHYDNTGTTAAYINMGEDETGIWFAGAVSEDLPEDRRRILARAGGVSGDWRRIGSNLEAVALLAVNVPGFPIPKVASRIASGVPQALVASGIVAADALVPAERIDYRRLAAEVSAFQARQSRRDAAARRVRKSRQLALAGRLDRKG